MRKAVFIIFAAMVLAGSTLLYAQAIIQGFPPGSFVSRGEDPPAVTYTGPGDVISGALFWYSCTRAYNAAVAATNNNACLLVDSSTGAVTYQMKLLANGNADVAGAAASTACAVACKVKTANDQTGNGLDVTQATLSAMPTFTFNCVNTTLPCLGVVRANSQGLANTTGVTQATPTTAVCVAQRTGTTGSTQDCLTYGSNGPLLGWNNSSGHGRFFAANSVIDVVIAESTWQRLIVTFGTSGSTGVMYVNNSSTSGAAGTQGSGTLIRTPNPFTLLDGKWLESGVWAGNKTSSVSALDANIQAYYGL